MRSFAPTLLVAALAMAACGVEQRLLPDAAPAGPVTFGRLDVCPARLVVAGGFVYWASAGAGISRSPIDGFAPEVVYDDATFDPARARLQRFRDALVWPTGNWPVTLDPATREVRPLVDKAVTGLAVVDGYRVFVSRASDGGNGDEIDEIGDGGALMPVVPAAGASIDQLAAGPRRIFWQEHVQGVAATYVMNVLTGTRGPSDLSLDQAVTTYATDTAFYAVVPVSGTAEHALVSAGDAVVGTLPSGTSYQLAGGDAAPLYLGIDDHLVRVARNPNTGATVFPRVDTDTLGAIGGDRDLVFVATCTVEGVTLSRLYPEP